MKPPGKPVLACVAVLACLCLSAQGADAPLRVGVAPTGDLRRATPTQTLGTVLGLYLADRLSECRGVRLVSRGRMLAIVGELRSGVRDVPTDRFLAAFSEYVPIDAFVSYTATDEKVTVVVLTKDGPHRLELETRGDPQKLIHAAARFVAQSLGLAAGDRLLLAGKRFAKPDELVAYYSSQVISAQWPMNSGEYQLKALQNCYTMNRSAPPIAARILLSAESMLAATNRLKDFHKRGTLMARYSIIPVLGTPWEPAAHPIVRRIPEEFEKDLLGLCGTIQTSTHIRPEELDAEAGLDTMKLPGELGDPGATKGVSEATRIGALRVLAVMKSPKALKLLLDAANSREEALREAAAFGLRFYGAKGRATLEKLSGDPKLPVAFRALLGLRELGEQPGGLLETARKMTPSARVEFRTAAAGILADGGTAADAPALQALVGEPRPAIREAAARGLLRLNQARSEQLATFMSDPDERIVIAALNAFPKTAAADLVAHAQRLANDPLGPIGQAARIGLGAHRPAPGPARLRFDLAIEHPYLREKLVDRLAVEKTPWALDMLAAACDNPDPYVRAYALRRLVAVAPERADRALARAITDSYRWVRLHAAALLAAHAAAPAADAIRTALKSEKDRATRLYLEDALARAEGRPLPKAQPAAHSVAGKRNLAWLCGAGEGAPTSPFEGYYMLSSKLTEPWRKAHDAGKIFFARIGTVGSPGTVIVDRHYRDAFWLAIDHEITPENLPYLDGVVFGEESMKMAADTLWPGGWRLFCIDAGIDAERIKGDASKLTPIEARAWRHWAAERHVDGFNELYDYVHLKYGKLRPGMQVCTFLPEQGHLGSWPPANEFDWKFDVGGIYHYKSCTRTAAYTMVRRYKTLWPDRPILWLSLGIGGYEMNPVRRTQKVPETPILNRYQRAWADSVTAWMAGADTGWFSTWIFVEKDWKGGMHQLRGVQILVEDIVRDGGLLNRAIAYAWKGAEEDYTKDTDKPKVKDLLDAGGDTEIDSRMFEADKKKQQEKARKDIEAKIEAFRRGFYLYGQYVYDCARVLKSLPRNTQRPRALAVRPGISIWSRPATPNPLVPGMALLNTYDFLLDVNKCARLDLSRYRLIVIHDPGALTDSTIAALTRWLRETPGLLYIHHNIVASNAAEASTPEDHDGVLKNDWPWEADVTAHPVPTPRGRVKLDALELTGPDGQLAVKSARLGGSFDVTGPAATAQLSAGNKPCLVLWRKPGAFRGAVLFDGVESASGDYLEALKKKINTLHKDLGVGLALDGPILHNLVRTEHLTAASSTAYYATVSEKHAYPGVDLLTGEPDPVVGGGRRATVIARDWAGTHVASFGPVAILCENPIAKVEKIDGGLRVLAPGRIRAAGRSGAVTVTTAAGTALAGRALPVIDKDPVGWVLFGATPGTVTLPGGKEGATVTYIRSDGPVEIRETK